MCEEISLTVLLKFGFLGPKKLSGKFSWRLLATFPGAPLPVLILVLTQVSHLAPGCSVSMLALLIPPLPAVACSLSTSSSPAQCPAAFSSQSTSSKLCLSSSSHSGQTPPWSSSGCPPCLHCGWRSGCRWWRRCTLFSSSWSPSRDSLWGTCCLLGAFGCNGVYIYLQFFYADWGGRLGRRRSRGQVIDMFKLGGQSVFLQSISHQISPPFTPSVI